MSSSLPIYREASLGASEALAHPSGSGIAQITTETGPIQGKTPTITLETVFAGDAGLPRQAADALDSANIDGAYLHVPFCFHKCHYCDFYSIVDSQDRQKVFTNRLIDEMRLVGPRITRPLQTIFIGGGTPTLLRVELWRQLLSAIREHLPLAGDGEFTVEANPETVTDELAEALASGGVNRVSIGAQSFDPRHLKTLERWHDPANVARSVGILRRVGIANLNLDLIFAVPGQSADDWLGDLEAALSLQPSHISCYGLMYEHNTPLTMRMHSGAIQPVDQDVEAAMYEATIERLAAAGYEHYEISNWAREKVADIVAARCRHNLLYWCNANWWAFGPSASGHVNGLRWKNVARLGDYLDSPKWPPIVDPEFVDQFARAGELFMLGLRLIDGLSLADVDALLEVSGDQASVRRAAIERHRLAGLLEVHDQRLRLTRRGLLMANDVLVDLI